MNMNNYSNTFSRLSNSGLLSDEVYSSLISNIEAPDAAIAATLISNSPMSRRAVAELEEANFDEGLKGIVMLYQDGINSREMLEYSIGDVKQEISLIESGMMRSAINNDSVPQERAAVIEYFEERKSKSYDAYINIINLELLQDDVASAQSTLNELEAYSQNLEPEIAQELSTYCAISDINIRATKTTVVDTALIVANKELILTAATDNSSLYSSQARGLYSYISDTVFKEPTPLPGDIISRKKAKVKVNPDDLFRPQLKLYPNPSNGIVFIEYDFRKNYEPGYELLFEVMGKKQNEDCGSGVVKVYNINGTLLQTSCLAEKRGLEVINIENYPSGIYMVEVSDCYGNLNSVKLVKK
jgi:hypothetical protein